MERRHLAKIEYSGIKGIITFAHDGRGLWHWAQDLLTSPVRKTIRTICPPANAPIRVLKKRASRYWKESYGSTQDYGRMRQQTFRNACGSLSRFGIQQIKSGPMYSPLLDYVVMQIHCRESTRFGDYLRYKSGVLRVECYFSMEVDSARKSIAVKCTWTYRTPEGMDDLVMSGDGEALTGLWFKGSRDDVACEENGEERDLPVFRDTCRWLDEYFVGHSPDWTPTYRMEGLTEFRKDVIDEMLKIPFGTTASYGDIAKAIANRRGVKRISAQAVGGAVGWNPICIIIPCHRVIGASGKMVGYGGGVANKVALLAHEARCCDYATGKLM